MWIWLLLAVLPSYQVNGGYWLSTAETHILFSGDIEVSFGISISNLSLRIQLFQNDTDGEKSIATRILPTNMIKGKIIFPCGTFQAAGQYVFKLLNAAQGELLTESNYVNALWPEVAIHVPLMVETYSSNVIVQLYTDHLKCRPRVDYQIFVDLLYEGSVVDAWLKPTILTSKQLTDWMWNSSFDVTLGCEFFDRAGNYSVHVRKDASKIASSDIILVIWSHRYSVSVAKRSIQPCDGSLSVIYHYPRCILDQDRIRVYGKSVKGPLKYIRESRIINGKHATKLSCDIFEDGYQEYCFNFVSIARNGAVFDLKTHCIPTLVESKCISKVLYLHLNLISISEVAFLFLEEVTVTTTEQPQLLDDCPCGCEKNATDKIVLKAVIQRCDSEVSYIMHAWPSGHVVVNILSVAFPTDNYWLIIRDGKSPLGPVLALMEDVTASNSIHSITRTIRLEIHVSNSTTLQEVVLVFSVMQSEIPRESLAMVRHHEKSISISSNLSAVHVTIIMLATVLFSTTAVLILFHFCRYMRTSSISQNTQALDSPELLTSTSELSIKSPSIGPEDYLYNSFIFRSSTSLQPRLKWDKLPPKVDVVNTASPVRRRSRPIIKNAQRESATPLTASVSELSTTGSDDGLEYDYYDYGCHQEPGSFFCPDPVLMGWPPFIPLPPQGIEEFGDYPLQNFTPSPEPS
ncbi:uncharacterized protein [Parasteatoda tepidariorum]|uniref:uncharacterized protein n=1 Tax=Parasteatoda tepidariorum TaxID=114398 RepID=UPI001C71E00E|nr:uncharacterized protein LOC107442107 [Parasteatoda tepidariorum]